MQSWRSDPTLLPLRKVGDPGLRLVGEPVENCERVTTNDAV